MNVTLRISALTALVALIFLLSFFLFGERFEGLFDQETCVAWFASIRSYAWLIALLLLIADLILPIPATGIMAALGHVYGVGIGGAVGALGSTLAGMLGYTIARLLGANAVARIANEREREQFQSFFDKWGGAGIIISRALPILPEVMSVLAGLASMSSLRFTVSILLGTVPTAFFFSSIGHAARTAPAYGLGLALLVPFFLWLGCLPFIQRKKK